MNDLRLTAVARLLGNEFSTVADIGTDHGYLSVYLVKHQQVQRVIGTDISEKSLKKAEMHTCTYDNIETRVGDGFEVIGKDECQAAVIAGIGGVNICEILERAPHLPRVLVIQPMGHVETLRRSLGRLGYGITDEQLVYENRRYYFVIRAEKCGTVSELTREELRFGPVLLQKRDRLLKEFMDREIRRLAKAARTAPELEETVREYEEAKKKWFVR